MVQPRNTGDAIQLAPDYVDRHLALTGFPEPPAWMGEANCAGTDPEMFFPEKGGSTREAKKVCSRCTVQAECLDWALDRDERFGIFGGLSERERRKLQPPPTCPLCDVEVYARGWFCDEHRPPAHTTTSGRLGRVRAWARTQGIPVNAIGNLPLSLIQQYDDAHPHDPAIHENTQETA